MATNYKLYKAVISKEQNAYYYSLLESIVAGGVDNATAANQVTQIALATDISNSVTLAPNSASVSVAASATVVTLAALNANRKTLEITNDGVNVLYIKKGASASLTDYTYKLFTNDTGVIDDYTGVVTGIWDVAVGTAIGTETSF